MGGQGGSSATISGMTVGCLFAGRALLSLSLQVVPVNDRISNVVEQSPNVAAAIIGSYAAVDFLGFGLRAGLNDAEQLARLVPLSDKLFMLAA